MDKVWYLYSGDSQRGPYSEDEISSFLASGEISHQSFLWRDGFSDWKILDQISPWHQINDENPAMASLEPVLEDASVSAEPLRFDEWMGEVREENIPVSNKDLAGLLDELNGYHGLILEEEGLITGKVMLPSDAEMYSSSIAARPIGQWFEEFMNWNWLCLSVEPKNFPNVHISPETGNNRMAVVSMKVVKRWSMCNGCDMRKREKDHTLHCRWLPCSNWKKEFIEDAITEETDYRLKEGTSRIRPEIILVYDPEFSSEEKLQEIFRQAVEVIFNLVDGSRSFFYYFLVKNLI